MKLNFRFFYILLLNLIYIAFMGWVGYKTWQGIISVWFGLLLLIVLSLRLPDMLSAFSRYATEVDNYSIDLSISSGGNQYVTPEFILGVLDKPQVIQLIKIDLTKTGQIGYREEWRLGLLTLFQDVCSPNLTQLSTLERTAILHSTDYFKHNNIVIKNGAIQPLGIAKWSYGLSTRLNRGEFINIRNIQMEDDSRHTAHRAKYLPEFLREDGFPIREYYADGDPLTADRGGTIVINKDKLIIIYPRYFIQRRLIDEEGNLVDLGIDENFNSESTFEVDLRPSVSRSLIKRVEAESYTPVLRYRSIPSISDYMFPILDTPMSANGWADLYIDPSGKARLFISKEKTEAEWYEMMNRLKQLFYSELARKNYHLLGLTRDKTHLNAYLRQKQEILKNYFIIQDWKLP